MLQYIREPVRNYQIDAKVRVKLARDDVRKCCEHLRGSLRDASDCSGVIMETEKLKQRFFAQQAALLAKEKCELNCNLLASFSLR